MNKISNDDIVISFSRGKILFFTLSMYVVCILFLPFVAAGIAANNILMATSFLAMLFLPSLYALKSTKRLLQPNPAITICNKGYTNYLHKDPLLVTWEEMRQGTIAVGARWRSTELSVITETECILLDENFNYPILNISPKGFVKILNERCA
jgi:hypothetical protein